MTPTARTLAECRRLGWLADVVERRIPKTFITKDLFGCIDIVVLGEGQTIGIQATSGSNHAARIRKIIVECREAAQKWLECGNALEVWSWKKAGNRFLVRREAITLEMLG